MRRHHSSVDLTQQSSAKALTVGLTFPLAGSLKEGSTRRENLTLTQSFLKMAADIREPVDALAPKRVARSIGHGRNTTEPAGPRSRGR